MIIKVPDRFFHVGDLTTKDASVDPRRPGSMRGELVVDLRSCQFVRPAAVLWCVVYPLLAARQGVRVQLLVPENLGVALYLQSVGLFDMLKEAGVDVDDRGVGTRPDQKVVLPLSRFSLESEVEELTNLALESLSSSRTGSANLDAFVAEAFAELAMNAVQHSESPIDGFGFIQFYETEHGKDFVCAVADGGIGIRAALTRNPALASQVNYDWDAIELALRERVSGTGSPTRGIGLYGISEDMRRAERQLIIHSGIGRFEARENVARKADRSTLFPGTLAYVSIPG